MAVNSAFPTGERPAGVTTDLVYLIDDNVVVRRSLVVLLETLGISSRSFMSALEFLHELPSLAPAPLLLDLTMPGMSGIGLMEALAARKINWPVLVISALTEQSTVRRAKELGVIDVLEKPPSPQVLELSVRRALAAMAGIDAEPRAAASSRRP